VEISRVKTLILCCVERKLSGVKTWLMDFENRLVFQKLPKAQKILQRSGN